jgi:hypothetical protein
MVGGPDHIVFLPEDKSNLSRRSRWADSTRLSVQALLGVRVRLAAQMETAFVLRARKGPSGGAEFKGQSASNQRYDTKRYIYHNFPVATAMP